jgi:hypothetical protein
MRAVLTTTLLAALAAPGCSLLFDTSRHTSGDVPDAPGPLDAPVSDVGDAPLAPDVPTDTSGLDAPFDPTADHWPATCADAAPLALVDARGDAAAPSTALRTALSVTDAFGLVEGRRLTVPGDTHGRVVMGRTTTNDVLLAVASEEPGPPALLRIDRATVSASSVSITNFPTEPGTTVVDLAMARMGTALRLALLVEVSAGARAITSCDLSGATCVLDAVTFLAGGYFPQVVAMTREGSTVHVVTAGPTNESGGSVCIAQGGGAPECDPDSQIIDGSSEALGDGAETTGGLLAVLATTPDLTGALPDRLGVRLIPHAIVGAFERDDEAFTLVRATPTDAGEFEVRSVDANCLGGGGCLPLEADAAAFEAQEGSADVVHAAALTGSYAFAGVVVSYGDDAGTDVRLYALDGESGLPLASQPFVTLGSGRAGPGATDRSMAITAVSDGSSYDVYVASVRDTGGLESVYLSAIRYCR